MFTDNNILLRQSKINTTKVVKIDINKTIEKQNVNLSLDNK